MRIGIVGSLVMMLASAGLTLAQTTSASSTPPAATPTTSAPPTIKPTAAEQHLPAPTAVAQPPSPAAADTKPPLLPPPPGTPLWDDGSPPRYPDDDSVLKQCLPCGYGWLNAEYLLWWMHGQPTRPLVTTGPTTAAPATAGTIGSPGTHVLFGGQDLAIGMANGLRINGGFQGPDHGIGIEGGAFLLEQRSTGIALSSNTAGVPVIARPFIDVSTGQNARLLTSLPGAFAGALQATASSQLFGGEANLTKAMFGLLSYEANTSFEIDALAGFRYLDLSETLGFRQNSMILPGGAASFAGTTLLSPTQVSVADQFANRNQFYGPQLGCAIELQRCHFFFYGVGKIGLGVVHETENITGATTAVTANGTATTVPGGLFALPSNIGRHVHNEFAAVPEVNLNLGYQLTRNLRVSVGYDLIYWSVVARPGDQITGRLNTNQLPTSPNFGRTSGPNLPAPDFHRSDFWADGVNLSLAYHF